MSNDLDDRFIAPLGSDELLAGFWANLLPTARREHADVNAARDALLERYAEPHRSYHNHAHLISLLSLAHEIEGRRVPVVAPAIDRAIAPVATPVVSPAIPPVIGWAIWFHDAIYAPMAKDNEARSAALARATLGELDVASALIAAVELFIRATQRHELLEDSDDLRIFLDLDLSIFAAPEHIYDRYTRAIRREYRWVPAPLYRSGRRKVLASFAAREQLYFSATLRPRFEAAARLNLARELATL